MSGRAYREITCSARRQQKAHEEAGAHPSEIEQERENDIKSSLSHTHRPVNRHKRLHMREIGLENKSKLR